ncbi:MAG TPA: response regulator transcription factor [Pyrinomonadaceae bacterium]|jgi:DNA-binding NarL/FixJ family response regulator|nr:response regulator transcription factor [Pyrinomonadaceae bacterium]
MATEIRVVIADDHPVFRQGLRQIIELENGLSVIGEAGDGAAALALIRELQPQVAVLDINMPELKGFDVARELRRDGSQTRIIFLTMYDDERMFNEAMNLDALGYLLKDSAINDVVESIRAVAAGRHFITPSISGYLLNRSRRSQSLQNTAPNLKDLTPAEMRILKLIAENHSSKQIAEQLFISYRTVENHRANICQKLGLHGSNALVRFALAHKFDLP